MFDICSYNRIPKCALCPFLAAAGPLLILLIASSLDGQSDHPSPLAGSRPTALLGAHSHLPGRLRGLQYTGQSYVLDAECEIVPLK